LERSTSSSDGKVEKGVQDEIENMKNINFSLYSKSTVTNSESERGTMKESLLKSEEDSGDCAIKIGEEKEKLKLFEGKTARHRSSCISKMFAGWAKPVVDFTN
jgi:hypothetical protein